MGITTGELAFAGIGATLLASVLTTYLNNRAQAGRLKAETDREREKWLREDKRAAAERWAERRYGAHSDFLAALNLWSNTFAVGRTHLMEKGDLTQSERHNMVIQLNAATTAKAQLNLISEKAVLDAAEWVVQAAFSSTGDLISNYIDLRNGPVSREYDYDALETAYRNALRRYSEAARAELGAQVLSLRKD